jgi:hypothetical protein
MFGPPRRSSPPDPLFLIIAGQLKEIAETDYFKRDPVGTLKRHAQMLEDVAYGK